MDHHDSGEVDYGTGQKKLSVYLFGIVSCAILTLVSFWMVMAGRFSRWEIFTVIYSTACIQFFVQLICFLRLNTQTEQGRMNVMVFVFSGVILATIILGSLWIMWNLGYNMMN